MSAIDDFLADGPWAVVGASTDRAKFGNRVLRSYVSHGLAPVYGVHPIETEVEGVPTFPNLAALPETPRAISIITPPPVTDAVVADAIAAGVRFVWMQPGAESAAAIDAAAAAGLVVIAGGPCILVELNRRSANR